MMIMIAVESHGAFSTVLSPFSPLWANAWPVPPATSARCYILSVIVQRFNSVLMHESFVSADEEPDL